MELRESLLFYAVTDRRWLKGRSLAQCVELALRGGVTMIQLREKELDEEAFLREALELRELTRRFGVPLIINDSVEIARACGADGVHIGQDDESLAEARAALGPDRIVGVSAHSVEEARKAFEGGADYLGCGAVFPTGTKQDVSILSREELRAITSSVPIPAVAIGGITAENLRLLAGTCIAGAALVSAVFAQERIEEASRSLRKELQGLARF